jgi:hypothetical protein
MLPTGVWVIKNGYLITKILDGGDESTRVGEIHYWDLTHDRNQIIYPESIRAIYPPGGQFFNHEIHQKPGTPIPYGQITVKSIDFQEHLIENHSKVYTQPDLSSDIIYFQRDETSWDWHNAYNFHPAGFEVYTLAEYEAQGIKWILINYFGYAGFVTEGWIESKNINWNKKVNRKKYFYMKESDFQKVIWNQWDAGSKDQIIQLNREFLNLQNQTVAILQQYGENSKEYQDHIVLMDQKKEELLRKDKWYEYTGDSFIGLDITINTTKAELQRLQREEPDSPKIEELKIKLDQAQKELKELKRIDRSLYLNYTPDYS